MGAHATPWDAEVFGLFVCKLASALRKGIKEKQDHGWALVETCEINAWTNNYFRRFSQKQRDISSQKKYFAFIFVVKSTSLQKLSKFYFNFPQVSDFVWLFNVIKWTQREALSINLFIGLSLLPCPILTVVGIFFSQLFLNYL